jgi:NNP family nitrate/nitrite transporter-like MFS transporter
MSARVSKQEGEMAFIELALKGSSRQALFFATLAFFSGLASASLFGPTVKLLRESMGLTPLQAGLLVAIPTLSGSLGRIPFGAWVETGGGKKPILCLLSTATLGMAGLLALVATYPEGPPSFYYPAVLFFGLLAGFGIATFSAGAAQVSYWFPRAKQGAALGIYGGLSNLAPGVFAALIPLAVGEWGLTGAYAAWLLFLVVGTVAFGVGAKDAYFFQLWREGKGLPRWEAERIARRYGQELFPAGSVWGSLAQAARNRKTWLLVALYFVSFGGFLALTAWFPTYWGDMFGFGLAMAGTLTMVY